MGRSDQTRTPPQGVHTSKRGRRFPDDPPLQRQHLQGRREDQVLRLGSHHAKRIWRQGNTLVRLGKF